MRLAAALMIAVGLMGCGRNSNSPKSPPEGRRLGDVKLSVGATRQIVVDKLGEPDWRKTYVFKGSLQSNGYGPFTDLGRFIKIGQKYEQWDYVDGRGDIHVLYFSDPSQPQADPSRWKVLHTAILRRVREP